MNCDDLKPLMDAYLDSELDPRTTLEVQNHLSGCTRCAAAFARAGGFERHLGSVLRHGDASPELWEAVERRLDTDTAPGHAPVKATTRTDRPEAKAAESWWRFWLWPSPQAYAALTGVWAILIAIALGSRETSSAPRLSTTTLPLPATTSAEMKSVLAQQHRLRAELLDLPDVVTASERPTPPQSRTRSGARSAAA